MWDSWAGCCLSDTGYEPPMREPVEGDFDYVDKKLNKKLELEFKEIKRCHKKCEDMARELNNMIKEKSDE